MAPLRLAGTPQDASLATAGCVASACFLVALIAYNFVDIDLWHQMALIRESLAAGHLLRGDVYAYVPTTRPWIDHEWGAGAIAYFAVRYFGARALILLKLSLGLGTYLLCWRASRSPDAHLRMFAACSPLAIFLMHLGFFSTVRAQAYTFFFTALLVLAWRRIEQGSRLWLFVWLGIFPLWVNLHGGFVVGIGLTALYCVEKFLCGEPTRSFLLLCAAMLLETVLTPYRFAYFAYLARALPMSRPVSAEWGGIWNLGPLWVVCFLASLALAAYALATAGIRNAPGLLPLAATAIEAAFHRKLLPIFAVIWLCYTPIYLAHTKLGESCRLFMQRRHAFVLGAWVALACVSIVAAVRGKPWQLSVPQPIYPVGPVKYLAEQHAEGNLMVPFRLGAYVSWRLYPAVKVSLDSRYEEVFPDPVVRAVFDFYEARPGWQKSLESFPPDLILVPLDAPVAARMKEIAWARVYHDREFDIFTSPRCSLPPVDWSALSFTDTFP